MKKKFFIATSICVAFVLLIIMSVSAVKPISPSGLFERNIEALTNRELPGGSDCFGFTNWHSRCGHVYYDNSGQQHICNRPVVICDPFGKEECHEQTCPEGH